MCQRCHRGESTDRRNFLLSTASTLGAAGVLGLFPHAKGPKPPLGGRAVPSPRLTRHRRRHLRKALPVPLPIPGGTDVGPPLGLLHIFQPGPRTP